MLLTRTLGIFSAAALTTGCATMHLPQYSQIDEFQQPNLTVKGETYEIDELSLALPIREEDHVNLLYPLFNMPTVNFNSIDEDMDWEQDCARGTRGMEYRTNIDDDNYVAGSRNEITETLYSSCIEGAEIGKVLTFGMRSMATAGWDSIANETHITSHTDVSTFSMNKRGKATYFEIDESDVIDTLYMEDYNLGVKTISNAQYELTGTFTHLVTDYDYAPLGVAKISIVDTLVLEWEDPSDSDSGSRIVAGKIEVLGKDKATMTLEFNRWSYDVSVNGADATTHKNGFYTTSY